MEKKSKCEGYRDLKLKQFFVEIRLNKCLENSFNSNSNIFAYKLIRNEDIGVRFHITLPKFMMYQENGNISF